MDLAPLPVQSSDTPLWKLSTWNAITKVQLVVVRKSSACGAHVVMEGKEDYSVCGASP